MTALETGHLSLRELCEGNLEGGLFLLGTLKDMLSKALEMGVCFHGSPVLGNMGGRSFPGAFERWEKFIFLLGKFYEEFERHVKEGSGNRQLSPKGPLLGNLEGVHLPGPSERQMERSGNGASLTKLNSAPFLDPHYVTSLSLGAIRNCCEGPRLP